MKKIYTVFLLLLALSVYAQKKEIKETSEKGVRFEQNGEEIKVYIPRGNVSDYHEYEFVPTKDGVIEVRGKNNLALAYSSPNDVAIIKDAAGNKYWRLIDGTIAKTELARETSASKEEITSKKEEQESVVEEVSTTIINEEKIVSPQEEVQVETTTITEEKPVEEIFAPESQSNEENSVETVPSLTPQSTEEKEVEIAPNPIGEEKIIIEEVEIPEDEKIITVTDDDGIEEIKVTKEEVGDVSDFFEKNYDDMTRKEKKLYRKNEKKIMRQLEKELKREKINKK